MVTVSVYSINFIDVFVLKTYKYFIVWQPHQNSISDFILEITIHVYICNAK